jgi:hypothetical protein
MESEQAVIPTGREWDAGNRASSGLVTIGDAIYRIERQGVCEDLDDTCHLIVRDGVEAIRTCAAWDPERGRCPFLGD